MPARARAAPRRDPPGRAAAVADEGRPAGTDTTPTTTRWTHQQRTEAERVPTSRQRGARVRRSTNGPARALSRWSLRAPRRCGGVRSDGSSHARDASPVSAERPSPATATALPEQRRRAARRARRTGPVRGTRCKCSVPGGGSGAVPRTARRGPRRSSTDRPAIARRVVTEGATQISLFVGVIAEPRWPAGPGRCAPIRAPVPPMPAKSMCSRGCRDPVAGPAALRRRVAVRHASRRSDSGSRRRSSGGC